MPKRNKPEKNTEPKIHDVVLIDLDLIDYDENNVNKQSRETFELLCESMEANGWDENMLVVPSPTSEGRYLLVQGHHRHKAGKKIGFKKGPCVVHDDWDETKRAIEGVKRNYSRGSVDKSAFTRLVDDLQTSSDLGLSEIQESMGFDLEAFAEYYNPSEALVQEEKERISSSSKEEKDKIKVIENLELIISHIMETYGNTLLSSFLIFPTGGRKHLLVQTNSSLKNVVQKVAAKALERNMDLAQVISGLLTIGLHNSDFLGNKEQVEKASEEHETDPNDTDFSSF